MKHLVILGTGGNSVDIMDTANDINRAQGAPAYECVGFLDDDERRWGECIHGVEVLGPLDSAGSFDGCVFASGIGSPTNFWLKHAIIARTGLPAGRFETIVHPTASVSRLASLGRGVIIFQHVTVTSNARLGDFVTVLPGTVISHDAVLGDYTTIAGGVSVSGGVRIGAHTYVGTRAAVIQNASIGERCLVGMGSVVLEAVPDNTVVAGTPARALRSTVP